MMSYSVSILFKDKIKIKYIILLIQLFREDFSG